MSITRSPKRQTFTIIDNSIINDRRLPFDTLGLLVWLLSKPDSWNVNAKYIQDHFCIGRKLLYRMLGQLQELGYAHYTKRNDGHTDWIISEAPTDTPYDPEGHKPHAPKPDQAKGHVLVKTERAVNTELSNNTYWTQENLEKEWAEFKAMRKQIKRPVNATAETRIIAKLKKLQIEGHPPSEVLDISTENCWKGVFAIKKENHNGHKRHHGQSQTTVQTPLDRCNEAIKRMDAEALAEDDSLVW